MTVDIRWNQFMILRSWNEATVVVGPIGLEIVVSLVKKGKYYRIEIQEICL